jgi:hypothetical protein
MLEFTSFKNGLYSMTKGGVSLLLVLHRNMNTYVCITTLCKITYDV